MINKLIATFVFVLAVCIGFYLYTKYRVAPSINFSTLSLSDLNGNPVKFDEFKGKKLVVCFSASWCGNCWQELKAIDKIKLTQLQEVDVLVISDEPGDRVLKFDAKFPGTFKYLKLATDFASIGIHSIPTTYIFDTQLQLKREQVGYLNWEDPSTLEHLKKLME
jgi:peroxiredoxin